jgi:hypothetical protein
MQKIHFNAEQDEESSLLVASWDEPDGKGGVTTQGRDLVELRAVVHEAVLCHFDEGHAPETVLIHVRA